MSITLIGGQLHGNTKRTTTWDDRYLMNRVSAGQQARNYGMPRFMISSNLFFTICYNHGTALGTHHDLIFGSVDHIFIDLFGSASSSHKSSLIHKIFKIGS